MKNSSKVTVTLKQLKRLVKESLGPAEYNELQLDVRGFLDDYYDDMTKEDMQAIVDGTDTKWTTKMLDSMYSKADEEIRDTAVDIMKSMLRDELAGDFHDVYFLEDGTDEARLDVNAYPKVKNAVWHEETQTGSVEFLLGKIADKSYYPNSTSRRNLITLEVSLGRHFSAMAGVWNANTTDWNWGGQIIDKIADHEGQVYPQLSNAAKELLDEVHDLWKQYHLKPVEDIPDEDLDRILTIVQDKFGISDGPGVVQETSLEDDIIDYIKVMAGKIDYNQMVEDLMEEFAITRDEAEGYIQKVNTTPLLMEKDKDFAEPILPSKWRIHVSSSERGYYNEGGEVIPQVFNTKRQAEAYAEKTMRKYCDRYAIRTTDANTWYGTYKDGSQNICCTLVPAYD